MIFTLINDEKEKELAEKRFINKRIAICTVVLLVMLFGFVAKLFLWQVVEGKDYRKLADSSTAYTVTTDATRGEILDRSGVGLAVNRTGYRIALDKLFIDPEKLNDTIHALIDLMDRNGEEWIDNLPIKVNATDGYSFIRDEEDEIKTLKSEDYLDLKNGDSAEYCISLLCERSIL